MDTHKNEPAGGSCWTALGHGVQATWSLVLRSPPSKPQCCDQAMSLIGTNRTSRNVRVESVIGGTADDMCSGRAFRLLTQKRHHPDEARTAGRSAIPCYPTPIDFIEEARPLPRRVLRSPSGGPSTSSGPCAIFKRSGLAVGCPRVAQCMDRRWRTYSAVYR